MTEQLYSIRVSDGLGWRWLTNVKKNLSEVSPKFACTFDKVQADRVVAAFTQLGFKQKFEVVPTPQETLDALARK